MFNGLYGIFVQIFTGFDNHLISKRIMNVFYGNTPQDSFFKTLYYFAAFQQRFNLNTYHRSAVILKNNTVLGNIGKPSGKIT